MEIKHITYTLCPDRPFDGLSPSQNKFHATSARLGHSINQTIKCKRVFAKEVPIPLAYLFDVIVKAIRSDKSYPYYAGVRIERKGNMISAKWVSYYSRCD